VSDGIGSFVRISPAVWPGRKLEIQPGDLARFAPMGNGLVRTANTKKLAMYRGECPDFRAAAFRPGLCDELWCEIEALTESTRRDD